MTRACPFFKTGAFSPIVGDPNLDSAWKQGHLDQWQWSCSAGLWQHAQATSILGKSALCCPASTPHAQQVWDCLRIDGNGEDWRGNEMLTSKFEPPPPPQNLLHWFSVDLWADLLYFGGFGVFACIFIGKLDKKAKFSKFWGAEGGGPKLAVECLIQFLHVLKSMIGGGGPFLLQNRHSGCQAASRKEIQIPPNPKLLKTNW